MESNFTPELLQKLAQFKQKNIQILKTESAYENRYRYAPLDLILDVIQPELEKVGLSYVHWTDSADGEQYLNTMIYVVGKGEKVIGTYGSFTSRTRIDETAKLSNMNKFMVIGSALTYFRRYHLVTMLGLTTDEDTDAGGKQPTGNSGKQKTGRSVESHSGSNEQDYLSTFKHQIKAGKDEKYCRKVLETYKKHMSDEQVIAIESLIIASFKK